MIKIAQKLLNTLKSVFVLIVGVIIIGVESWASRN